jgi:hypothetical protein
LANLITHLNSFQPLRVWVENEEPITGAELMGLWQAALEQLQKMHLPTLLLFSQRCSPIKYQHRQGRLEIAITNGMLKAARMKFGHFKKAWQIANGWYPIVDVVFVEID